MYYAERRFRVCLNRYSYTCDRKPEFVIQSTIKIHFFCLKMLTCYKILASKNSLLRILKKTQTLDIILAKIDYIQRTQRI